MVEARKAAKSWPLNLCGMRISTAALPIRSVSLRNWGNPMVRSLCFRMTIVLSTSFLLLFPLRVRCGMLGALSIIVS